MEIQKNEKNTPGYLPQDHVRQISAPQTNYSAFQACPKFADTHTYTHTYIHSEILAQLKLRIDVNLSNANFSKFEKNSSFLNLPTIESSLIHLSTHHSGFYNYTFPFLLVSVKVGFFQPSCVIQPHLIPGIHHLGLQSGLLLSRISITLDLKKAFLIPSTHHPGFTWPSLISTWVYNRPSIILRAHHRSTSRSTMTRSILSILNSTTFTCGSGKVDRAGKTSSTR